MYNNISVVSTHFLTADFLIFFFKFSFCQIRVDNTGNTLMHQATPNTV